MNNVDPAIEELIRDSEKVRIITTILENEEYPDSRILKMICGINVPEPKITVLETITKEFTGDAENEK